MEYILGTSSWQDFREDYTPEIFEVHTKLIQQNVCFLSRELAEDLRKYGMRCIGKIDITKPRWNEDPIQLVPSIISNIRTAAFGEHRKKFKKGEIEAEEARKEIVSHFVLLKKMDLPIG